MTLEVPPKKEIIVYAPLTAKQEALYTAVVNKTITQMLGVEKVTQCDYSSSILVLKTTVTNTQNAVKIYVFHLKTGHYISGF